jgi:hypothetical protein
MDAHQVAERLKSRGWTLHEDHTPPRFVKGRMILHWPFEPYERLGRRVLERLVRLTDLDASDLRL